MDEPKTLDTSLQIVEGAPRLWCVGCRRHWSYTYGEKWGYHEGPSGPEEPQLVLCPDPVCAANREAVIKAARLKG